MIATGLILDPQPASTPAVPDSLTTVAVTGSPSTEALSPTPTSTSTSSARLNGSIDYLAIKAEAEEKLRSALTDGDGVRYRDVHTKLSTLEGGGIVAFCGEENSRTPLGGYGGFQRFVASRSVAVTEGQMEPAEFAQAWSQFCDNAVEGPQVWF